MKRPSLFVMAASVGAFSAYAGAVALFTGSLGTDPTAQGYLAFGAFPALASPASSGGKVTLDTTAGSPAVVANVEDAGYSNYTASLMPVLVNPAFPSLDPATGFILSFDLKINSESHNNGTSDDNDRAGFSVILEGSDKKGIELGFWDNQIWAQADGLSSGALFTHAEGTTSFDPTTPLHSGDLFDHYDLSILGSTYSLSADGTTILTGSTRDYDATAPVDLTHTAYHEANFVFLGDDTTDARASADLFNISISVPEPSSMGLILASGLLLVRRRSQISESI